MYEAVFKNVTDRFNEKKHHKMVRGSFSRYQLHFKGSLSNFSSNIT